MVSGIKIGDRAFIGTGPNKNKIVINNIREFNAILEP